ncbi:zinc ribbon domain-containing protein [Candidatus Woesebacteria bacterium]|nr:zinc ribbon domain-containing protein [Candidatus Woesebacteria bacterium]MCD8527593.1 zinc ribbon domain-containing protein [Candidatus Woesebacteria bacterium]MCD8546435.1 zinc ribbon domain-containing protein [Candidatus Woesebacteria bacterium]
MYCNKCGKSIDEDSNFCNSCGAEISTSKTNNKEVKDSEENTSNRLWDKFVEIYDSKGEERKRYENLTSDEAWELISRISNNKFEDFIQEHKDQLNKQPYKVIETLKNVFSWCTSGGYWFWMAQAFLREEKLNKPKNIALNKYIKEWQALLEKDFKEHKKEFLPNMESSMSIFFEHELNNFIESAESVKDLPNEIIEQLKIALFIQLFWGYLVGVAEAEYRK